MADGDYSSRDERTPARPADMSSRDDRTPARPADMITSGSGEENSPVVDRKRKKRERSKDRKNPPKEDAESSGASDSDGSLSSATSSDEERRKREKRRKHKQSKEKRERHPAAQHLLRRADLECRCIGSHAASQARRSAGETPSDRSLRGESRRSDGKATTLRSCRADLAVFRAWHAFVTSVRRWGCAGRSYPSHSTSRSPPT